MITLLTKYKRIVRKVIGALCFVIVFLLVLMFGVAMIGLKGTLTVFAGVGIIVSLVFLGVSMLMD